MNLDHLSQSRQDRGSGLKHLSLEFEVTSEKDFVFGWWGFMVSEVRVWILRKISGMSRQFHEQVTTIIMLVDIAAIISCVL